MKDAIRPDKFLYREESFKIGDACRAVWQQFGGAFKEIIIDNALTIALQEQKLTIENQKRIPISYSGKRVGTYVLDKVVNGVILIEVKCKPYLTKLDERQFWYYLKATPYRVGFLVNFGNKLEVKRRIYDTARNKLRL